MIRERSNRMERETILKQLNAQIKVSGHIIGAVAGSGMTANMK